MLVANKEYLDAFFSGNMRFEIPFFQRPYVWDVEEWEPLWENLMEAYDAFSNGNDYEHFVGTLITKKQSDSRINETILDLIDGQQRLTTFSIILKALANSCNGQFPKLEPVLNELIQFEDTRGNKFNRIIHNKVDRPNFQIILDSKNGEKITGSKNKLIKAYNYFLSKFENWDDDQIDNFKTVVLKKIPVVSMILSPGDDEQVIFDTINSLGVKLTTAELLKNYIFQDKALQEVYNSSWFEVFESDEETVDFWGKDRTAGRISRTNAEVLLYCFLIIERQSDIKLEKLFKEYKDWIGNLDSNDKRAFLQRLKEYADIYSKFPEGTELNEFKFSDTRKRFFHVIESLNISTVYPLILYVYKKSNSESETDKCLSIIESYLIRRNICRLTTKNYNNLFLSIIQQLSNSGSNEGSLDEKLNNIFTEYKDETNLFPTDDQVFVGVNTSYLTNQNSKEILYCIALYQRDNPLSDNKNLSSSSYSVEHILPKKWEYHWNRPKLNEIDAAVRNRKLLTLGNLTLITKRLNSTLKNHSWKKKRKLLSKYSTLEMTTNYLDLEEWNEKSIEDRGKYLYEKIINIWKK